MKSTRDKQAKSKSFDETVVKRLEDQHRAELLAYDRKATIEVGYMSSVQRETTMWRDFIMCGIQVM